MLARGNRYLDLARALDHPAEVKSAERPAPTPKVEARPVAALGHRHRGLAARSLHDLRPLHSAPAAARCRRHAAGRARPRHRHPRRHRRLHQAVRRRAAGRSDARNCCALGEKHFAPLADYPEARAFWWPRFLRIAQWFAQWDGARRAGIATLHAEIRGELKFPVGKARVHAVRHRRPHRAAQRRQLRHHRLQDRRGAHRKAGAHRPCPAIDAGSRHPARRRLQERRRPARCPKSPTSR